MSGVVLVTPIGLDARGWAPLAGLLGEPARVHELPGFGRRLPWATPPTLAELADDLVTRCTGALDLVGVSTGAIVAQNVAIRHPERVRSLLSACAGPDGGGALAEWRAREALGYGMLAAAELAVARWFGPAPRAPGGDAGVRYVRTTLTRQDPRSYAAAWRAVRAHEAAPLAGLAVPTTVLRATNDRVIGSGASAALAEAIPGARSDLLDASHMAHLDAPETFSRAVRAHLAWSRRPKGF